MPVIPSEYSLFPGTRVACLVCSGSRFDSTLDFRSVPLMRTLKCRFSASRIHPAVSFVDRAQMSQRSILFSLIAVPLTLSVPMAAAQEVSFRNDVMPVLSKAGCNLGTCHGNARGKGGFQLSLRGQDPDRDYRVLTREWLSRRTNSSLPEKSLLLLKPTMQVAHEGGRRFDTASREYRILREWIAAGTPDDRASARKLTRLHVAPLELFLTAAERPTESDWQAQLTATAEFSDGTRDDVTSQVVYESSNPIAEISPQGLVTGQAAGETTVLVRFQQLQVPVRLAFVPARTGFAWSAPAPANVVDEQVYAKLKRLRVNPSPICDDATFVRRVHLDLLGILPTAKDAQAFVARTSPDKRSDLIDALLNRPEFADWWALKWADLLRIEEKTLDRKGVENFHGWLRDAFATNKPLDVIVREIVAARGSTYEIPPANFYRALRDPFERSEAAAQLFLGARLQCAKCHNHPFDRWTQDDYYSWASVFARVDYKIIENNRRDQNDKHEFDGEQIVFLNGNGTAKDPRTDAPRPAMLLGAGRPDRADPLRSLANWLATADNKRFVQVLANRTWQQLMGRGIVEPVDDFRATNPPSNPELLDSLCEQLRSEDGSGTAFDLRQFLRLILNSNTYQASSSPNESNRDDVANFSHTQIRRLTAEQLIDGMSHVLDTPLRFSGYPTGPRAVQIPGIQAVRRREGRPSSADLFLTTFGKPPRLQTCDCERSDETTLSQAFQSVSGSLVHQLLTESGNRIDALIRSSKPTAELVSDLYWNALSRAPTDDELLEASRYIDTAQSRRNGLEDVTWALLNSHEFLLRH